MDRVHSRPRPVPNDLRDARKADVPIAMIEAMVIPMLADDAGAESASGVEVIRAMLIVLGIVIIAVMLVLSTMGKITRRQNERPSPREQIEQAKAGGGTVGGRRAATETSAGSIHSARQTGRISAGDVDDARHLATLLDNKAERLEQLLAEADDCIARLDQSIRMDAEGIDAEPAAAADTDVNAGGDRSVPTDTSDQPADPLTRSVYELADEGHDSIEIAQKLDEQVGKIDLILALRQ